MKNKKIITALLIVTPALLFASSAMATSGATAYINGNIYTANAQHEFVNSVVIEDGIFKYVGNNAKVASSFNKNINVVDLKGKTIVPGLYDSHIHPIGAGEKLLFECQIPGSASTKEILNIVEICVNNSPADSWVIGAGWGLKY